MLDSMRAATQTWLGRAIMTIVMGFIILSFAVWGIGDIFRGFGANDLAKVGGTNISADAYRYAYQTELQRLQRQLRRAVTNDEARAFGLDGQVLSRLISEAALDQKARSLDLAISDQQIAKTIYNDDAFKDAAGRFDKLKFDGLLRENGFTERSFVADQRGVYLRRQIADAVSADLEVPKAMIEALNRFQGEARSVDYVVLPATAAGEIAPPSQDVLEAYYKVRQQNYRTPEYRKLVVLALTPTKLAETQQISDEDAQKRYDEVKAQRYETPEKRTIEQIPYPDEASAAAARAEIDAGKSFDDLIAERKLTPKDVSLGTVTKDALVDKAVADAAFSLPEGNVSAPIKAQFGTVLLRASKIDPASTLPFSAVAGAIKQELQVVRAKREMNRLHDEIEDQRASGKSLTEAAKSVGLEPRTIEAIDSLAHDKTGFPVPDLPNSLALVKAAFASDVGVDNDTLSTPDGGTIWFEVAGIDPARQQTFDEVKPQVEKAWMADETAKRLTAKAADWIKKIAAGETLASLAAEGNLDVKHANDVKREGAAGLPAPAIAQIFNVPVKGAESAADGDGRIVFQVLESTVPPLNEQDPSLKKLVDQVKGSLTNEILGEYVTQLQKDLGVSVNNQALRAASGTAANY
ncbi:peptidylprolyl isomerase [Methyloferula stellata]|uniref:peptidylprolyl isomerase n=1 Tax=Methyloferula stellata TaxID=876270 RepID=UPI00037D4C35|nr:peptidylprolyl isomerase [Methyloferula stellata]